MQYEARKKWYPETYSYTLMGSTTERNEVMRQIWNFYPKVKVYTCSPGPEIMNSSRWLLLAFASMIR